MIDANLLDPALIETLTGETAKIVYAGVASSAATIGFNRFRNKRNFNRAAQGNRVSPEIKVSLLQWEEGQTPDGTKTYDVHSTTKSMDLRKVLAEEYKDEMPKLIVAAAKQATLDKPFITDHIDAAAKSFGGIKTPKARRAFAESIHSFIDEETKYIIQNQWGGGSVLQHAYEVSADNMESFYGLWVHEQSDDVQEIRLLVVPGKYLHEHIPNPDSDVVRVREGAKGGNGFFIDETGTHSHLQRLKILQKAVDRLKSDSDLRGKSWISLPVRPLAPHQNASLPEYIREGRNPLDVMPL